MTVPLVVVFDVGKTNAKLTAFAPDLSVAWSSSMPNASVTGEPFDHADTDTLFAFLVDGLADIARLGTITDIVPTTHGATAALVGEDGLAVPIMDYEWLGIAAVDEAYDAARPPFEESGSPRLPGGQNVGRQIFFVARALPDVFRKVRTVLPYPQYWVWRLTGARVADPSSLGAHTDLWAPRERVYSSLVARMVWTELMPPVIPPDAVAGAVRSDLAQRVGLTSRPRVRAGIHDSNASLMPFLNARDAPFTLVSSGTWVIVFAVGADPDELDDARDTLLNVNAYGDPVPSARFMGGREYQIIVEGTGEGDATLSDAVAVMESGAMILPTYVPNVGPFPWNEPYGREDPRIAPGSLRRAAASLYVALVLNEAMALAGAKGPILLDGPIADDPVIPAAVAAFTLRGVERVSGTGSSAGAARLAGLNAGIVSTPVTPFDVPLFERYRDAWRRLSL